MTTAETMFDVYEHAGPRAPFLMIIPSYSSDQELVPMLDFWREHLDEDVELFVEWNSSWDGARALWQDIERCCHQAERMMALQPDYARSLAIYELHLQNMTPLLMELRAAMLKCGCHFPELKHTAGVEAKA